MPSNVRSASRSAIPSPPRKRGRPGPPCWDGLALQASLHPSVRKVSTGVNTLAVCVRGLRITVLRRVGKAQSSPSNGHSRVLDGYGEREEHPHASHRLTLHRLDKRSALVESGRTSTFLRRSHAHASPSVVVATYGRADHTPRCQYPHHVRLTGAAIASPSARPASWPLSSRR